MTTDRSEYETDIGGRGGGGQGEGAREGAKAGEASLGAEDIRGEHICFASAFATAPTRNTTASKRRTRFAKITTTLAR